MTDFRAIEFDSLRAAIRMRMTLAPALVVAAILGWATLTLWVFTTDVVSAATLVPLMVLAAGFESVVSLRVHAERLASFIEVAYEGAPGEPSTATPAEHPTTATTGAVRSESRPRWETTARSYRQQFGAFGSNGVFTPLFLLAAVVNYLPAAVSGTLDELVGIGFAHGLFALRILVATRRVARMRGEDVERFRVVLAAGTTKNAPDE